MKYDTNALKAFAQTLLLNAGLPEDRAACVAEVLLEGDLLGHTTHGLALLSPYLGEIQSGGMQKTAILWWSVTNPAPCFGTAVVYPVPGWCDKP